ncbi:hypothetical protein RR46_13769 [Papilio xuthus]|uniref:Uncharacterized protein n=1 Tax=Papilio xuthus TaxID=66420 RepID=A0A194PHM2_PAPXU|nr:hypothetical protein RR46_13769 [Papilio xuthus]
MQSIIGSPLTTAAARTRAPARTLAHGTSSRQGKIFTHDTDKHTVLIIQYSSSCEGKNKAEEVVALHSKQCIRCIKRCFAIPIPDNLDSILAFTSSKVDVREFGRILRRNAPSSRKR